ncbi:hypothetical protein [Oceanobacillus senegalensis]|uniref:hypothetical protein n=1 Tax=Oceanobacillus senegalensis TaxID=1936063 RepID=UPI00117D94A1|nr:hypothetical protein [Oceanobacillus senegalensis]
MSRSKGRKKFLASLVISTVLFTDIAMVLPGDRAFAEEKVGKVTTDHVPSSEAANQQEDGKEAASESEDRQSC